jgi:hypothetical protein
MALHTPIGRASSLANVWFMEVSRQQRRGRHSRAEWRDGASSSGELRSVEHETCSRRRKPCRDILLPTRVAHSIWVPAGGCLIEPCGLRTCFNKKTWAKQTRHVASLQRNGKARHDVHDTIHTPHTTHDVVSLVRGDRVCTSICSCSRYKAT